MITPSEAARALGSMKTEKKAVASRENGKQGGAYPITEEVRERRRLAQQKRRERERAAKADRLSKEK